MCFVVAAALESIAVACLLLTSIYDVTSVPEALDYDRQEELAASPKDLIDSLQHSLEMDLKAGSSSDGLYQRVSLPRPLVYSFLGGRPQLHAVQAVSRHMSAPSAADDSVASASPAKRSARGHNCSAAHTQTLKRIRNPCAGESTMPYSVGAPPSAAAVGIITPRNLLMTLSSEALRAKRAALNILDEFEEMGINHQHTVGMLGHAPSIGFSRTLRHHFTLRVGLKKDNQIKLIYDACVSYHNGLVCLTY